MVCVGGQIRRYHCGQTITRVALSPRQFTNRVAHVVAAYKTRTEGGGTVPRCRRDPPPKCSWPYFVRYVVGRTGPGLVVEPGWMSVFCLFYVSRVGPFCFCGDVGRYLRLAYRIGAPRALLYEGRRARYGGGGGLTSLQWHQATSVEVRFFLSLIHI